jgi:hypothetical protein
LDRLQVMGVLSSLAREQNCTGTSRLEKIESLTQKFLFPEHGANDCNNDSAGQELWQDAEADRSSDSEGMPQIHSSDAEAKQDAGAAIGSAQDHYLNRSPPSGIRRPIPDAAPELPYLSPRILNSPAKNVHISERRRTAAQWGTFRGTYDADAVFRSLKAELCVMGNRGSIRQRASTLSGSISSSSSTTRPTTSGTSPSRQLHHTPRYQQELQSPRQRRVQVHLAKQSSPPKNAKLDKHSAVCEAGQSSLVIHGRDDFMMRGSVAGVVAGCWLLVVLVGKASI